MEVPWHMVVYNRGNVCFCCRCCLWVSESWQEPSGLAGSTPQGCRLGCQHLTHTPGHRTGAGPCPGVVGREEGSIWPLLCLVHSWERKAWFSSKALNRKPWNTIPPELSNPLWLNISMPEDWWRKDVAPVGNYKFAPFSAFYSGCSISAFRLCLRCVQMLSAVSGSLLSYSCAQTLGKILILSGRSKTYVWLFGIGKQEERNLLRVMTWYNC